MSIPGSASPLFLSAAAAAAPAAFQIDRSLRFNSGDSAYLNRTPSSAGNRKTFTFSCWAKLSKFGTAQTIFAGWDGSASNQFEIRLQADDTFFLNTGGASGSRTVATTSAVYRDPSAWYHLVCAVDTTESSASNHFKFYINGILQTLSVSQSGPQNLTTQVNGTFLHHVGVARGLARYHNGYLTDVHFIDGQALAPTDFGEYDDNNVWQPKAYSGTYGTNGFHLDFSDNSSNAALGYDAAATQPALAPKGGMDVVTWTGNGSNQTISGLGFQPDLVWIKSRNTGNTPHLLVDSVRGVNKQLGTHSTGAETDYSSISGCVSAFNSDGFDTGGNSDVATNGRTYVGWAWKAGGTAVSNTDGTITSSVSANTDYGFSIVSYTGTGGTSDFGHGLNTKPGFVIIKNRSTGGYYWISSHSSLSSNQNVYLNDTLAAQTYTSQNHGGIDLVNSTSSVVELLAGLQSADNVNRSGDNYIAYCWSEVSGFSKFNSYSGGTANQTISTGFKPRYLLIKRTDAANSWLIFDSARGVNKVLKAESSNAESTASSGLDEIEFLSNGFKLVSTNNGINGSGGTYIYAAFADRPGNNWTTNNLIAEAGLETASQGMDVVTYTGNGSSQTISGLGFQPDFVWTSVRDLTGYNKYLVDSVRGSTKVVISNSTAAESTQSTGITSFNSDGFSVGSNAQVNENGRSMVAWCWKAGGTAVSNTDGTITSSVSANTDYGFSVVNIPGYTYPTKTAGHGLGVAPAFIISKNTGASNPWMIYHQSTGVNTYLQFDTGAGYTGVSGVWSGITSSVFPLHQNVNQQTDIVAYCWSEVSGFSKFGGYSGNGSTQKLTFGFKPAYVIIKRTDSSTGGDWYIFDYKRVSGTGENLLRANTNGAEAAAYDYFSFDEDGITLTVGTTLNGSGRSYIYAAFAGKPPGEIIDSLIDTPTNYEADSGNNGGNYATWNPLENTGITFSNGNLDSTQSVNSWVSSKATIGAASGKYYFEYTINSGSSYQMVGVHKTDVKVPNAGGTGYISSTASGWVYQTDGNLSNSGSFTSTGISSSAGDVIMVAFDVDAGKVWFGRNGTWFSSGDPATGANASYSNLSGRISPATSIYGSQTGSVNFGQRPFAYAPPTGYKSLCTTNLADPTIADGSTAMVARLRSGGGTTQTYDFGPDLVWIKRRDAAAGHHLFDTVRGDDKYLLTNGTGAENTSTGAFTFASDGYTISSGWDWPSSASLVDWVWDAGTSTVSNTDGSLTSSVRANPSVGFSIATFTDLVNTAGSRTWGHGLNAAPQFILLKSRSGSVNWQVYHAGYGTGYAFLNSTNAFTSSGQWSVTSTTAGHNGGLSAGANPTVCYHWTPVEGYSAFGSYTGNGSTDGPFVYTGFRPKFILIKVTSTTGSWVLWDTSRDTYNVMDSYLLPNLSNAETTSTDGYIDALSNGFKLRNTNGALNANGQTHIFACFAEHPFKTARAR